MKISELIEQLQDFQKTHGDLIVTVSDDGLPRDPTFDGEPSPIDDWDAKNISLFSQLELGAKVLSL